MLIQIFSIQVQTSLQERTTILGKFNKVRRLVGVVITEIIEKIAIKEGVEKEKLMTLSLIAYLNEKKKKYMEERLEILKRHNVKSAKELEEKIRRGEVNEHPAWEDLITLENLEELINEISDDIRNLQKAL